MSSLVARNQAPLIIPVSASLTFGSRDYTAVEFTTLARKLEAMHLTKHSIGISPTELVITSHIGEHTTREELTNLGFVVERRQRVVYQLMRRHDATRLLPESLADILGNIQAMRRLASSNFQSDTTLDTGYTLGHFDKFISAWYMPGNGRQLGLILPESIDPESALAPFDDLVIGSIFSILLAQSPSEDPATLREAASKVSFMEKLHQETQGWRELVRMLYTNSALNVEDEFNSWCEAYVQHLTSTYAELLKSDKKGMSVPNLYIGGGQVERVAAPPTPEQAREEIRNELPGVAAVKEPLRPSAHAPETPRPAVIQGDDGRAIQVRFKPSRSYLAWQIPPLPVIMNEEIFIPTWALTDLIELTRHDTRSYGELVGKWLVRMPQGVVLFTPEQFAYEFERL